jgi:hypothetical protein
MFCIDPSHGTLLRSGFIDDRYKTDRNTSTAATPRVGGRRGWHGAWTAVVDPEG